MHVHYYTALMQRESRRTGRLPASTAAYLAPLARSTTHMAVATTQSLVVVRPRAAARRTVAARASAKPVAAPLGACWGHLARR